MILFVQKLNAKQHIYFLVIFLVFALQPLSFPNEFIEKIKEHDIFSVVSLYTHLPHNPLHPTMYPRTYAPSYIYICACTVRE